MTATQLRRDSQTLAGSLAISKHGAATRGVSPTQIITHSMHFGGERFFPLIDDGVQELLVVIHSRQIVSQPLTNHLLSNTLDV